MAFIGFSIVSFPGPGPPYLSSPPPKVAPGPRLDMSVVWGRVWEMSGCGSDVLCEWMGWDGSEMGAGGGRVCVDRCRDALEGCWGGSLDRWVNRVDRCAAAECTKIIGQFRVFC